MTRRQGWLITTAVLMGLVVTATIALALRVPFSSDRLRRRVVTTLSGRLDAEVELGELTLRLLPRLHVKGTRLTIRHQGRRDVPPLIAMDTFVVDASLLSIWRKHIPQVIVEGLDIEISPKPEKPTERADDRPDERANDTYGHDFVIDDLVADNATLTINRRDENKKARVWQMHELRLTNVGREQPMPFRSLLTNALPPGQIATTGTFGPWNVDDPGQTRLNGTFTFDHADLSVFKGISGILSARGRLGGSLERIDVEGQTDTPDFMVSISGHTVPLKTTYHAIVDGTNGDTTLSRIDASFLRTSLVATGGVHHTKTGVNGRTVTVDITMSDARLEDVMRLVVNTSRPPMSGALSLRTKFELPPGDEDVVEKLLLNGQFTIAGGRFADPDVDRKISELSRRAGRKSGKDDPSPAVASDFTGQFRLGRGVLALPSVTFAVPSAAVQLAGRYGLRRETIDFTGNLFMDAKVSQTMTGWKSLVLKIVDPLFRRDGQTVIPIKIEGTRGDPSFGLDTGRVFNRDPVKRPPPPVGTKSRPPKS